MRGLEHSGGSRREIEQGLVRRSVIEGQSYRLPSSSAADEVRKDMLRRSDLSDVAIDGLRKREREGTNARTFEPKADEGDLREFGAVNG